MMETSKERGSALGGVYIGEFKDAMVDEPMENSDSDGVRNL